MPKTPTTARPVPGLPRQALLDAGLPERAVRAAGAAAARHVQAAADDAARQVARATRRLRRRARAAAEAARAAAEAARGRLGAVLSRIGASLGLGLLALALLVAAGAGQAAAQSRAACGERERVIERLSSAYGETRQGLGLQRGRGVMEIYASAETGTWTLVLTLPDGVSCLVAAGEGWERMPAEPAPASATDEGA